MHLLHVLQANALLGADSLERGFVFGAPTGCSQFGARLDDDGRFLGALGGGTITSIQ